MEFALVVNGPLGDSTAPNFDIVRRGYDIDAVDAFLRTQAAAWSAELHRSQERVAALEQQYERFAGLEAELASTREQLQTALEVRSGAEADGERAVQEAEARAAGIINDAKEAANRLTMDAEVRAETMIATRTEERAKQHEQLEKRHAATVERLQEAERSLRIRVEQLNVTRHSLSEAFEAIADIGLERLGRLEDELLELGLEAPVATDVATTDAVTTDADTTDADTTDADTTDADTTDADTTDADTTDADTTDAVDTETTDPELPGFVGGGINAVGMVEGGPGQP